LSCFVTQLHYVVLLGSGKFEQTRLYKTASTKTAVLWDVKLCSLLYMALLERFVGKYCLLLQCLIGLRYICTSITGKQDISRLSTIKKDNSGKGGLPNFEEKAKNRWDRRSRASLLATDISVPILHTKHSASHSSRQFRKHECNTCFSFRPCI
jgi:hypothetical protein